MINENNSKHLENEKYIFSNRKIFLLISIIFTISLLIRLNYYDYNIPLTLDSLNYFFYAMDIKITGEIPINYSLANNGWALFSSVFFSIFQFDNVNQYMQLQKILSIVISSLTVVPVYFLCKKYFNSAYSLIGAAIIGIEPHLVQNSLLGISDSLYIFLVASSLSLFLSSNQKMIYLSFGLVALSTIVRSEGIFLFFTISIMYFIIFRKSKKNIIKFIFALVIFFVLLTPMILYQNSIYGDDRMFGRAAQSIVTHTVDPYETGNISGITFILQGLENFPKYLGWNMIPIWIIFIPVGIILILKNINRRIGILITGLVVMSLPAFYAYSIPFQDGRYLFFLYPIFCVISLFAFSKFVELIPIKKNYFVIFLILAGIGCLSILYLNEKIDNEHEIEAFEIAKKLSESQKNVNIYLPENKYLEVADIEFDLVHFKSDFLNERIMGKSIIDLIHHNVTSIHIDNVVSHSKFMELSKENEISHFIVDLENNENGFFTEIYHNENDFPYIKKIFDSNNVGFNYKVKIFEIDYEIFDIQESTQ